MVVESSSMVVLAIASLLQGIIPSVIVLLLPAVFVALVVQIVVLIAMLFTVPLEVSSVLQEMDLLLPTSSQGFFSFPLVVDGPL